MIAELEKLAPLLEEPVHLLIWKRDHSFEVLAVREDDWVDAFPLPLEIQSAAAEVELILNTKTAACLEFGKIPVDFWEGLEEVEYGENLKVSLLGRSGRKYLEVFRGVSVGEIDEGLRLDSDELLKVTRWLREENLFGHRQGDQLMEILAQLVK